MRSASFGVALLGAARAIAQPATQPDGASCKVTIVLAPPDVRAEIEAWVRAEPRCDRELEVRVEPTGEGLRLSARDQHGHARERVVPDAPSAAVLVVSWMADDSLVAPDVVEPEAPATAQRPRAAIAPAGDDAATIRIAVRASRAPRGPRLSVGLIGSPDAAGVRGQLDLFRRGRVRIGLAGGWVAGDDHAAGQARLALGASRSFGRFSLRAQLGLGADLSSSDDMEDEDRDELDDEMEGARSLVWVGEIGILAGLRIRERWALVGGPLVQASRDGDPTLSVFVGVERGL